MLGAMKWDARIVGGVDLDGIFQPTLLSLSAHFVTSITSVLLLELEVQSSRPPLTIVSHPSTQIQDRPLLGSSLFPYSRKVSKSTEPSHGSAGTLMYCPLTKYPVRYCFAIAEVHPPIKFVM